MPRPKKNTSGNLCPTCGKSFKSAAGLAAHQSYVHGGIKKATRGPGRPRLTAAPAPASAPAKHLSWNYCPSCGAPLHV